MSEIHELVLREGRVKAKALARPEEQHLVDIAADILAEESHALGMTYSGFCVTSLPHRRLPDGAEWRREAPNGQFALIVEPGKLRIDRQLKMFGVPYGAKARLILLYLQTKAIQTNSREVELGRSMYEWMSRMDMAIGGKSYSIVREQANRISACRLTFFWDNDASRGFEKDSIIQGGIQLKTAQQDSRQNQLWEERVTLGETFFRALKAHPVPISETAVRRISEESLVIDIYIWLAYRLHALKHDTPVSWLALHGQFGGGYKNVYHFKPRYIEALKKALAVYPDAKVRIDDKLGLVLQPSRPAIAEAKIHAIGGPVAGAA